MEWTLESAFLTVFAVGPLIDFSRIDKQYLICHTQSTRK